MAMPSIAMQDQQIREYNAYASTNLVNPSLRSIFSHVKIVTTQIKVKVVSIYAISYYDQCPIKMHMKVHAINKTN